MELWQLGLMVFGLFNLSLFLVSYSKCKSGSGFGLTKWLYPLGMYVWGDVLIFSVFWIGVSLVSVGVGDMNLFGLIVSLFWVVRSISETIYWLNQQFSTVNREPMEKVEYYSIFQNNAVWFVQQIKNQCITVVALVFVIYFATMWIRDLI